MRRPCIMVAPNGARRGRLDHPALPVTMPQIVATAVACAGAGADALHLHVRDAEGCHSLDSGRYIETLAELRRAVPDLRVQITTEAAGLFDVATQLDCLTRVRPDWASISIREIARDPARASAIYGICAEQGTQVQHILYDSADIALLRGWRARSVVAAGQTSVLFVLGRYTAGQVASPVDLMEYVDAAPDMRDWMICAFGPHEHECLLAAARRGGDLRVGFENSLTDRFDGQHADNAASVRALRAALEKQTS